MGDARMKYPKREGRVRLSVTVPEWLAQWARAEAKANGVPISAVVEAAVRRMSESLRETK